MMLLKVSSSMMSICSSNQCTLNLCAGGTYDILEFSGEESGGVTTFRFTRKINTGDSQDYQIPPGFVKVLFAFHPEEDEFK